MARQSNLVLVVLVGRLLSCSSITVRGATTGAAGECGEKAMSFPQFVQTHGRTYEPGSSEYAEREAVFNRHLQEIEEHNCAPKGPWKAAVNHLADWTDAELKQLRGHKRTLRAASATTNLNMEDRPRRLARQRGPRAPALPPAVSWKNLTSIQDARDQGACGSCWAFAAETVMRAHAEIAGRPHRFSVSQLVACTPNERECGGKGGCEGATAELAYEYAMVAGVVPESEFAYPAGGGQQSCPASMAASAESAKTPSSLMEDGSEVHRLDEGASNMRGKDIGMVGWTKLPENREEPIMRALAEHGPIAVAVAAGQDWNFYFMGVMSNRGCGKDHVINHAVVLFGYGSSDHPFTGVQNYWHVKNSWGRHWGEEGHVRLERTATEEKICGWDQKPQEGSGCIGGPPEVYVCGTCGILYDTVMPHFVKRGEQIVANAPAPAPALAEASARRGRRGHHDNRGLTRRERRERRRLAREAAAGAAAR